MRRRREEEKVVTVVDKREVNKAIRGGRKGRRR